MPGPMILVEGLLKIRSQSDSVFELQVPHFSVLPGQMVAVTGESGCGKSTLLDILAMVMEPAKTSRFEVSPDGTGPVHDVAALWKRGDESALAALRRDFFGYVLQTGGLLPFLSVRENIRLPIRVKGEKDSPRRVEALAKRLGVEQCLDRSPLSLSIGQRQRVAILRALAHSPRLVLADEPTAAVDKTRARIIMDDMRSLAAEENVAVVVVTHDVELAVDRADTVYTFKTTRVTEQTTRSVCRQTREDA